MSRPRKVQGLRASLLSENVCWKCRLGQHQRFFSSDRTFAEASLQPPGDNGPTDGTTKWRRATYSTSLVRKSFTSKPGRARIRRVGNDDLETPNKNTFHDDVKGSEAKSTTLAEALSDRLGDLKPFPKRSPYPMLESVQRTLVNVTLDSALEIARHQNNEHEQSARPERPDESSRSPLVVPRQGTYRSKTSIPKGDKDSTWAIPVNIPGVSPLANPGKADVSGTVGKRMYTTSATKFAIPETQASPVASELFNLLQPKTKPPNIRDRLQAWQKELELSGERAVDQYSLEDIAKPGALQNAITSRGPINHITDTSDLEDQDSGRAVGFMTDDDQVPEKDDTRLFLRQGDLVDLLIAGSSLFAIFIQHVGRQAQFYTIKGKWIHRLPRNVFFSVPRFVKPSFVVPLLPYLPKTLVPDGELDKLQSMDINVPREAGAPLIEAMMKFESGANQAYRKHADKLDNAYTVMADERHFRYATTMQIAMKVLQARDPLEISMPTMFAVHRALVQDDLGFKLDYGNHRETGMFEIAPRREVVFVKQVRQWLRQYQENLVMLASGDRVSQKESLVDNPIPGFIEKARRLIVDSRRTRAVTQSGGIGPSSIKVTPVKPYMSLIEHVALETFTEAESVVIRFLEFWSARRSMAQYSSLSSLGPMILRAIGMYEGFELGEGTGFTLLQELGVIAPWENRVAFNTRLALPGHNYDLKADSLQEDAYRSINDWQPKDAMAHLRKHWDELDVYCIDRAEAQEIDDGFSLEKIDGDPSQFWVHVHVANPTSFISPDHPMAQFAAHLTETLYFPEKIYYMLSPKVTRTRFSLGNDRPSLTFSAKINLNGKILDTKITPSTIENVHFFTPGEIRDALAVQNTESKPTSSFSVGGAVPDITRHGLGKELTQKQIATLRILQQLGAARRRVRESRGSVNVQLYQAEPSVYFAANGKSQLLLPWRSKARRLEGDPVISMAVGMFNPIPDARSRGADEAEMLVPDMMILAGEVAAMWCSERNIPVLYRGTQINPELLNPLVFKKQILDPAIAKCGYPPFLLMAQYIGTIGKGVTSSAPHQHVIIGTDAYTKVTSPLRRYGDMLAHWQIEAAIRHEASTGTSLLGSTDHSFLPFSRSQIDTMLPRISDRERMISTAKRRSQRHWVLQLLFRAHYFKEAPLPDTFQTFITAPTAWNHDEGKIGIMRETLADALLYENEVSRREGGIQVGDWWACRIRQIDVYQRKIELDPVRLVERLGDGT